MNNTQQAEPVMMPSQVAQPTRVNTLPQQASTQPGDGADVHTDGHMHADKVTEVPGQSERKVPFKEQVIGVAQKTRGTLLGKQGLKEHGEAILDGKTTHEQDKRLP